MSAGSDKVRDTGVEDDLEALRTLLKEGNTKAALVALAKIETSVKLMRQRNADQELVRLGHIVRQGMKAEQYLAAKKEAMRLHPEAWVNVLPIREQPAKTVADNSMVIMEGAGEADE